MLPKKTNYRITLTNITEKETFCYSLPIIKGFVSSYSEEECDVREPKTIYLKKLNYYNNNGESEEVTSWPVIKGNFKCLATLDVGDNEFVLEFENCKLTLNLEFKRKKTNYHVLPVYIICCGHDGRFQAPDNENNSPESACKRISLGSKLIQSFTAEKLFESNMGRKTFQLAADMNLGLDCIVFRSKLTPEEVYRMEPEEIWERFGRELMSSCYGSDKRKFLAFLSCTKYTPSEEKEPETYEETVARMQGHIALGGGGLAIFGTGCLHTWPETIFEVLPRFLDDTKVDKTKFMDDSCYRGTYGSCFSTTLGSVCHELGHAFDLGHSKKGIMARGFDNISLVFTIGDRLRDANKNGTFRSEPQHATVCFARNLDVSYSMSSPIKRPRPRIQGIRHSAPRSSASKMPPKENPTPRPPSTFNGNDKKKTAPKVLTDDLTFWDKSCSVLLKYHRWFASSDIPDNMMSSIDFDQCRNIISSPSGIRVVELRGDGGLVLASWEFLNTYLPKQFTLPLQNINMNYVKMIVAEDSMGSILKESLVTG